MTPETASKPVMPKAVKLAVLLLVQAVLLVVAVWQPLSARATGTEVRLAVTPLDPIDPFRGAYVALDYPGLPHPDGEQPSGTVYVPLRESGELWTGAAATSRRPDTGPYLTCRRSWQLRCGIESWFVAQDEARRLEQQLRDGHLVAVVRVDSRGSAALVGLEEGPSRPR